MTNPHHIDLILNIAAPSHTSPEATVKAGTVGIFVKGVFEGANVIIEQQPAGSPNWYSKPAGEFTDPTLTPASFWVNGNLSEGKVRARIENGTGNTVIEEVMIRPVSEYEYEV